MIGLVTIPNRGYTAQQLPVIQQLPDQPVANAQDPVGSAVIWAADFTRHARDSRGVAPTLIGDAAIDGSGGGGLNDPVTWNSYARYFGAGLSLNLASYSVALITSISAMENGGRIFALRAGGSSGVESLSLVQDNNRPNTGHTYVIEGGGTFTFSNAEISTGSERTYIITKSSAANGLKLYQDGSLITQDTSSASGSQSIDTFEIGAHGVASVVKQVLLFDRPLTSSEVSGFDLTQVLSVPPSFSVTLQAGLTNDGVLLFSPNTVEVLFNPGAADGDSTPYDATLRVGGVDVAALEFLGKHLDQPLQINYAGVSYQAVFAADLIEVGS